MSLDGEKILPKLGSEITKALLHTKLNQPMTFADNKVTITRIGIGPHSQSVIQIENPHNLGDFPDTGGYFLTSDGTLRTEEQECSPETSDDLPQLHLNFPQIP